MQFISAAGSSTTPQRVPSAPSTPSKDRCIGSLPFPTSVGGLSSSSTKAFPFSGVAKNGNIQRSSSDIFSPSKVNHNPGSSASNYVSSSSSTRTAIMMNGNNLGITIPSSGSKRCLDQCDTPGRSKRVPGSVDYPSLEYHNGNGDGGNNSNTNQQQQSAMIVVDRNQNQEQVQGNSLPMSIQSPVRSTTRCSSSFSGASTPQSSMSKQDRFIPNRTTLDVDYNYYLLTKDENEAVDPETGKPLSLLLTPSQRKFNEELNNSLKQSTVENASNNGGGGIQRKRLVECRTSLTPSFDRVSSTSSISEHIQRTRESKLNTPKKAPRIFPSAPKKVLDAPGLINDYYLNLLHWGQNNVLGVALGNAVYLWFPEDGRIDTLLTLDDENSQVTSIQYSPNAQYMSVGTSMNTVQLWDVGASKMVREMAGHNSRVSSLSWQNQNIVSSGSRDSLIINHDFRVRRNCVSYYTGHQQEVCGLTWSPDGTTLASGGNDNMLCIWDAAMNGSSTPSGLSLQSYSPRLCFDQHHTAAVKAISWCPWQRNILASGGGTIDRTIRIWNSSNGSNLKCVDTGSQVCAIQWSDTHKELVSSHGFSDNQLIVWRYADMSKLHELRGHEQRVLHLAKSPCGTTICSASADETLRFWDVFPSKSSDSSTRDSSLLLSPNGNRSRRATSLLASPSASMSIR